jgi:large subunit ribosomal protein L6
MSRIGKLPVSIPQEVKVIVDNALVRVEGPKGSLTQTLPPEVSVSIVGNTVVVALKASHKKCSAVHGLTRSLVANMVMGVSKGFEKTLELIGIGYRVELKGRRLQLNVGYSHPILFDLPTGITARVEGQTKITLEGADKQLVGETSAIIRRFKKPEPYKGKGIRYANEMIKTKIGKKGIK